MKGNGTRTLAYLRGETDVLREREQILLAKKKSLNPALVFCLTKAQNRRIKRFWQVASLLHENSRMSLVEMSKRLKIPISTLFDTLKEVEKHFNFTIVLKDVPENGGIADAEGVDTGAEKEECMHSL